MRNWTFHVTGPGVDSMTRATADELDDALELVRLIVEKFKRDEARRKAAETTGGKRSDG